MTKSKSSATLIILDGARPDVFDDLAKAGELPNISRFVLEPGGSFPSTTVFPSTTGVAYLPFLTGCYPGTCGIPGIRWLDTERYVGRWWRNRGYVRNYCGVQGGMLNTDIPTEMLSLFDIEKDSIALCSPFTRRLGTDRQFNGLSRMIVGGSAHYTRGYRRLDRMVGSELERLAREQHRFAFVVLPGVDGLAHSYHPRHPKVLDLYREFDSTIGRYAAAGGLDGDHLLAIVSDHGMTSIDRHTDLGAELENRGLRILRHPIMWRRDPDAAVMVSGNSSAQIYLTPQTSRTQRWSISSIEAGQVPRAPDDLVRILVELEGVALVAGTEGPDVILVSRDGRAVLRDLGDDQIQYEPRTADVLELGTGKATKHEREWLALSIEGRFPDSPVQLLQLFRTERAGDLVISSTENADLRKDWEYPEHKSGHGGLFREHMRCLCAINQPVLCPVRSVDLFPLILDHLGHPVPEGIDGSLGKETAPSVMA